MAYKLRTSSVVTVASAGTAQPLSATSVLATDIIIMADHANGGRIFVGDSTVSSTTGQFLAAGESLTISTATVRGTADDFDLADIYVDAATNGDKARVAYIARK